MAKQPPGTPSPFNKLLELRRMRESPPPERPDGSPSRHLDSQTANQPSNPSDIQTSGQSATQPSGRLAKSADPDFTKFTVYVRRSTHRAAKLRAIGQGRELSEVVEELLARWAADPS